MKLENRPLAELAIGQTAEMRRLITFDDLHGFAAVSGNHNPLHLIERDGDGDGKPDGTAQGMFTASLISAVLGMLLPGPGTVLLSQKLQFTARAHAGEELVVQVRVLALSPDGTVTLETTVRRMGDDALIVSGEAQVTAPTEKLVLEDVEVPGLIIRRHRHFEAMLDRARPLPALPTAVVCPEDANSLGGALLAASESIITPVLVGHPGRIAAAAAAMGADLAGVEIVAAETPDEAAARACALVHEGRVAAVMKGKLHTDELLRPMMAREGGLRLTRRLSHVFVMDVPGMPWPLMVTDAAINIAPDLATKMDIVQNAIDLALSLGFGQPRVGVLSATETVNPAIQSSIDAALLSKMAERGQITGGLVDGPLAMDNAVNMTAARTKGITSKVAGQANILVVPGIDAGNMLAKQLTFLSHAEAAGIVVGAKVPVILTSRADSQMSRLASCAVAALHDARLRAERSA